MKLLVRCPAKINTFLSVGPRDAMGYHPLRTVFQAIGLFDELRITDHTDRTSIACDWSGLPDENTLTKVLRLATEFTELPPVLIELTKRIPAQSGLGGGSSNAGGLLRALAVLTDGKLSHPDLMEVARAVGSDVPFFLAGGLARGEGYGEILTLLDDPEQHWLTIARPNLGCDTQTMYAKLDEVERTWLDLPDKDRTHNDFESVAPLECIALLANLRCLGARSGGLCGSGSAVYGVFESRADSEHAAQRLNGGADWPLTWSVPTIGRSESLSVEQLD